MKPYATLKLTKEEFHDIRGTVEAQRKVVWDLLQGRIKEGRMVGSYEFCETPPKRSRLEKKHWGNRVRIYDALGARFDAILMADTSHDADPEEEDEDE